eukprot:CAMPEP_0174356042 /NCGR_PEP_ID=MMETSP0811_2-20130205/28398_1 /TAXON_ID=73025 ORGANISM="Eutreptiella gymnastica-like, Strain CCMP1594" /NCGR_SAMPLE_ID=MMETSP0811_2 /ASSEMBLY_ACC=CAM_ASM_000667 /LENGTH=66 /DNA_ID=CAMNT_0015487831 /DNA_START=54 /DNA_END=251 /DNA_ORIENTATION=-
MSVRHMWGVRRPYGDMQGHTGARGFDTTECGFGGGSGGRTPGGGLGWKQLNGDVQGLVCHWQRGAL